MYVNVHYGTVCMMITRVALCMNPWWNVCTCILHTVGAGMSDSAVCMCKSNSKLFIAVLDNKQIFQSRISSVECRTEQHKMVRNTPKDDMMQTLTKW